MNRLFAGMFLFTLGCQTNFTGSPHISTQQCEARCTADGLVLGGMVYMGEYSSACICEKPNTAAASISGAAAAAAAGAAGVVMQTRNQEAQNNSMMMR
jgi:hypothetical protein